MPSSSSAKKKDFFPSPETDNKKSAGETTQRNPITARSKTSSKNRFSTPTKQQQQRSTPTPTASRSSSIDKHDSITKSRRRSPSPVGSHHRARSSMFGTSPRFANITKDGFTIIESPRASPVQQVRRTASASAQNNIINASKEFTNTKGGVIGRADRWRIAETIDGKLGKDPKSDLVFRRSVSKDRSPSPAASRSHSESHQQQQQQQQSSSTVLATSKTTPHKISIRTPDHSAPLNNAKRRKLHIQQLVDVYRTGAGNNNNKEPLSVQSSSNISSPHVDTARAPFQPATQQNSPRLPNQQEQQQQQSYYDEAQGWNKNAPMLPNFIESVGPEEEKLQQKKMVRSNSTGGSLMTPRGNNHNNKNPSSSSSSPFFVARSPSVGVAPTNSVRSNRSASLRQQRSASAGVGLSANRRHQDSVFNRNPVFEKNFETNHHIDPRLSSPMYRKERSSSCFNNNINNRSNSTSRSMSQQQQPQQQQYHRSPSASLYYAGGAHQNQNHQHQGRNENETGVPPPQPPTATMGRTKRFSVAKDFDYQNLDAFFSSWLKNAKQTGLYQSPSSSSQQQQQQQYHHQSVRH